MIGRLKDVWGALMQASQNIPQVNRLALCPTKKIAFDLTSACVFLNDTQYQQRVVDLLKEYCPNRMAPNGAIKVYTVVHTMLLALTYPHTLWKKNVHLSYVEVEESGRWAKTLGQCGKLMGWNATIWVHWMVCLGERFVRNHRTMYLLSLVLTERRNPAYTLGTRLNIEVVPARTFQRGAVLVRNISYRNTTGTRSRDEITWCIATISEPCK